MKFRSILLLAGIAFAVSAKAEVKSFPECSWSETKIKSDPTRVVVTDPKGKLVAMISGEPLGIKLDGLVVSQAVDRLVIDASQAFKGGMKKLLICSANFDPSQLAGKEATLRGDMGGDFGTKGLMYFEGVAKSRSHFYVSRPYNCRGCRRTFSMVSQIPDDITQLHLRWDITDAEKGVFELYGAKYAPISELPAEDVRKHAPPELIFHAPFDGTADAVFAKGKASPLKASGLTWTDGRLGKAVRITSKAKSVLDYSSEGNLVQECGTMSMWFKREWPDSGRDASGGAIWRTLFANPDPKTCKRVGSGQLWFWWHGSALRADQSDMADDYTSWPSPIDDGWNHLAVSWDEYGILIYVNGRRAGGRGDADSPLSAALKTRDAHGFCREAFKTFCVGQINGSRQFDGLIDDLRIYSSPLAEEQVYELWRKDCVIELSANAGYALEGTSGELTVSAVSPAGRDISKFAYCICDESGKVVAKYSEPVGAKPVTLRANLPHGRYALKATDGKNFYGGVPYVVLRKDNPYELTGKAAAAAMKAPGRLAKLTLLESMTLNEPPPNDRFRAVGETHVKSLNGVPYLEAGEQSGNRYALRFNVDTNAPLLLFEIDYPDDAKRTADIIIQHTHRSYYDYAMQVGYVTGDEYPNTGRMLTHRCLYWTSKPDVALIAMTARANAPAAIAAVRIYRVEGAALPAADIREPAARGWNRSFSLYYEDPSIGYDFATGGHGIECLDDLIDRTAATMKFTGQNLFAYPGAWYHGLIGDSYNPRQHAPDFLSAWYAKFDREGLMIVPTLNPNTMPVPKGLVTRTSMSDGTLHPSPVAIHDTGKPNWGGWHDTPPGFNFHHPEARKYISGMIDTLVKQGVGHKSFKGVCLHMTRHCMLWFGDEKSGYNDYTVEAFAKARGLKIPVDKKDPLRGKAYAAWLRANAWEDWIQWRCDQVTEFYADIARKLAQARPDLKLWMNSFVPANVNHPDFTKPGYMEQANRACGLDRDALTKAIPNLILCQTLVPADYRWRTQYPSDAAEKHQRVLDTLPGFYSLLHGASYPWVNQHDRYWESPIGRVGKKGSPSTLSCDWLDETPWRVSTLNPGGFHALRHFVLPLRYGDVLGMSKGGFLIGTYGMEDVLVPFAQAFRALPAVVFDDVGGTDVVKLRQKDYDGKSWFYVVNTDMKPVTVTLTVPRRTHDLITSERVGGRFFAGKLTLQLKPYEMRSYSAPGGRPSIAVNPSK